MKLTELVQKYDTIKREMSEEIREEMKNSINEFFENHPGIFGLKWQQYTDYFNDGETCTFSRHEIGVMVNEDDIDTSPWNLSFDNVPNRLIVEKFIQELEEIPDDIYYDAFGDHVEITVTRDGFKIEDYEDHD